MKQMDILLLYLYFNALTCLGAYTMNSPQNTQPQHDLKYTTGNPVVSHMPRTAMHYVHRNIELVT